MADTLATPCPLNIIKSKANTLAGLEAVMPPVYCLQHGRIRSTRSYYSPDPIECRSLDPVNDAVREQPIGNIQNYSPISKNDTACSFCTLSDDAKSRRESSATGILNNQLAIRHRPWCKFLLSGRG